MPDNLTFSSHLEFSIPANDKKQFRKVAAQQAYRRIYQEAGQAWWSAPQFSYQQAGEFPA